VGGQIEGRCLASASASDSESAPVAVASLQVLYAVIAVLVPAAFAAAAFKCNSFSLMKSAVKNIKIYRMPNEIKLSARQQQLKLPHRNGLKTMNEYAFRTKVDFLKEGSRQWQL